LSGRACRDHFVYNLSVLDCARTDLSGLYIIYKSNLLLFSATTVFAQIPNAGFENWTAISTYSVPDGWGTLNNTYTVQTATKGTPGSPGSSYLKLTSKTYSSSVINGIAVSGVLDTITMQPKSGFAFNQQPANLTGKWQHMIYGTSQGSILVKLTRWDGGLGARVPVATGSVTLVGMAMSWANFSIPLSYVDSNLPDSCIIVLKASGTNPTNNDYLWVDNLAFSGSVVGLTEKQSSLKAIAVFPNPATDLVNINFTAKNTSNVKVELYDVTGKKVYENNLEQISGASSQSINVSKFAKGVYVVKIVSDNTSETRKIVIE